MSCVSVVRQARLDRQWAVDRQMHRQRSGDVQRPQPLRRRSQPTVVCSPPPLDKRGVPLVRDSVGEFLKAERQAKMAAEEKQKEREKTSKETNLVLSPKPLGHRFRRKLSQARAAGVRFKLEGEIGQGLYRDKVGVIFEVQDSVQQDDTVVVGDDANSCGPPQHLRSSSTWHTGFSMEEAALEASLARVNQRMRAAAERVNTKRQDSEQRPYTTGFSMEEAALEASLKRINQQLTKKNRKAS